MVDASSETGQFQAELEQLRAARHSWVELALALRRAKQRLAGDARNDRSTIFETWASRKLGFSDGLLRRYSVVLDFLIRSGVVQSDGQVGDVPQGLLRRFSVLELAVRIDKLSEKAGGEAFSEVLSGEASVRSLTERLRVLSKTHIETSTVRRSQAATTRPDRDRQTEEAVRSAAEQIYGSDVRLRRAFSYPAYVRCHFVADLPDEEVAGFSVINCQFKTPRQIQDAVAIGLFTASRFKHYYIVIFGGEEFRVEVDRMIDYYGKSSVGLIEVHAGKFRLLRKIGLPPKKWSFLK